MVCDVRAAQAAVLLVEGEAGIGKSRLMRSPDLRRSQRRSRPGPGDDPGVKVA